MIFNQYLNKQEHKVIYCSKIKYHSALSVGAASQKYFDLVLSIYFDLINYFMTEVPII